METFLSGHAGHRPKWEWFGATHISTCYFYGLPPGVKSRERNNRNALGDLRVCRTGGMACLPGFKVPL